jgi:acyl-CoA reductase-like NAD-dependent aldehyde dehydrogenase
MRLETAVLKYEEALIQAVSQDFGHRSLDETQIFEITTSISDIRYNRKQLKRWMKPRRVKTPIQFMPAKAAMHPQARGVVGLISPWNFPIYLTLAPLAAALSAGNRVMIKPSELTPKTSELLAKMLHEIFNQDEVLVINGDSNVAAQFSSLPFDHLLFTGSTVVGKKVAQAAAKNLTPVTLELGGKSPAIITRSANVEKAAERIAWGKSASAGQICVAPDYVLIERTQLADFCKNFIDKLDTLFPDKMNSPDYSAIISQRHYQRLVDMRKEVTDMGVEVVTFGEDNGEGHKLAPTLVINPPVDCALMQEEIFGPILPVIPYDQMEDAHRFVTSKEHPLALYLFSEEKADHTYWRKNSLSGALTINDTVIHVSFDTLPFGGVGHSGMGAYHGEAGFNTFSHLKPVVEQARFNGMFLALPPYGGWKRRALNWLRTII